MEVSIKTFSKALCPRIKMVLWVYVYVFGKNHSNRFQHQLFFNKHPLDYKGTVNRNPFCQQLEYALTSAMTQRIQTRGNYIDISLLFPKSLIYLYNVYVCTTTAVYLPTNEQQLLKKSINYDSIQWKQHNISCQKEDNRNINIYQDENRCINSKARYCGCQ